MDDNKNKVLRFRDVTLFTVSAMLFMDQIALAAALGSTSLFWWGYVLLLLFIPMGLMTAELGTTFPGSGGVYHWVRLAFGPRWGARLSWMYWANNALWMPSVYILFAAMLSEFFLPGWGCGARSPSACSWRCSPPCSTPSTCASANGCRTWGR